MGKSKNRFHAAKEDRWRRSRPSTWPCQAPANEFPKSSHKRFREWGTAEASVGPAPPPTNKGRPMDHNNEDRKARRKAARKAKRLLAGSNHRQLATTSLKGQGTAPEIITRKEKKKKQKKRRKVEATVEKAPTDYGDERRTAVVYTDGACTLNGKFGALAGIGVWWGSRDERSACHVGNKSDFSRVYSNLSERCPGLQTNNRAEIFAVVRLLEEAPTPGEKSRLVIRTDSEYTINCLMHWAPIWETQGWKTASGDAVKNASMIRYLLSLLSLRATQGEMIAFEHVRGHSGNVGNDGADALAKRGTTQPIIPDRNWLAGQRRVESVQAKIRPSKAIENSNMQAPVRFVIKESDCLSLTELEELERTQEF